MNPILSSHYPSCCARASRFPYVGKIAVGEKDVNFVYQFVKEIKKPYLYRDEDHYISGTPIKFPTYEDFPRAFCMRTYDFDISTSPWQDEIKLPFNRDKMKKFKNHFDILFHEAVYPIRVSVYEIYNPGNIIRIWAQDSDSEFDQWFLLWDGSPQIVPSASRLFSPPLESCSFKTKMLRLEFPKPSFWAYHTKLDAVMLIGTSKLILPRNPEESITNLLKRIKCMHFHHENEDVHNLTTDYKNAHKDIVHLQQNFDEYCVFHESNTEKIIYKSDLDLSKAFRKINPDFAQSFTQKHSRRLSLNDLNSVKRMKLSSDEPKELSRYNLSVLPDEIILKILQNLDLRTLCRLNQVNKRFYCLTQDSVLYKRLNVRNMCYIQHKYIYNIFCYFTPRCKNLKQLDLSRSDFSVFNFVKFLDNCGNHLTHLRLSVCYNVNNFIVLKISNICKNLKQLDLDSCKFINDKGFSYLEKLQSLEHLNVNNTQIKTARLCKILQKNQQIRQLHLKSLNINYDVVVMQVGNLCQTLEVLDLSCSDHSYTPEAINALADCKNLRRIYLDVYGCEFFQDSLNRLLSSCQRLEEIFLCGAINSTLESLTQCQNLKWLCLVRAYVTPNKFSVILEQCPKLQEIHLRFCNTNSHSITNLDQWKERYPHVHIYIYNGECEY